MRIGEFLFMLGLFIWVSLRQSKGHNSDPSDDKAVVADSSPMTDV